MVVERLGLSQLIKVFGRCLDSMGNSPLCRYLTSLAPLPVRRSFSILPMSGWLMPLARSSPKSRSTRDVKLCPSPSRTLRFSR